MKKVRGPAKCGFTVTELAVVTVVIGILAALALMPSSGNDSTQCSAVGRLFAGMIEYAQSLAIARPDQTYIIKVDQTNNRFWIANQSAPDTPLTHPIKKTPYLVQLGPTSTNGFTSVQITGMSLGGDNILVFDSTGMMDQSTTAEIELRAGGKRATVTASPITGSVNVLGGTMADVTAGVAVSLGSF